MPKAKPDKKQIRPTGYYDVKISAGEKGKSGKGVKKSVAEAVGKPHKSIKKGEKLDCRKRGNKKLKECVERALKKRKEKEAREKSGKRYAKSRKGTKQPKGRKKPKKHTTKKGVVRGGLPIATQVFRDDRVAGRGQPPLQIRDPQPQSPNAINMGFRSSFPMGAVYNQLQTAQVREREAVERGQTEVKKIFDSKQALSQRIEAQALTITQQATSLDLLRTQRAGDVWSPPEPTGMGERRPQPIVQALGIDDVETTKKDTEVHQDEEIRKLALQIKANDERKPPPSPMPSPVPSPYVKQDQSGFDFGEDPFDLEADPLTIQSRTAGRRPSRVELELLTPLLQEDLGGELANEPEVLTKEQSKDLNRIVQRYKNTGAGGGGESEVDFIYGGATLDKQKEAYNHMYDYVYGDPNVAWEEDFGEEAGWDVFSKIEGHEHMLAPLVRPIGNPMDNNFSNGITGDNYFGWSATWGGDQKRPPKKIRKSKKGYVMEHPSQDRPYKDDWTDVDPPPAIWEQVVFDQRTGNIKSLQQIDQHADFRHNYPQYRGEDGGRGEGGVIKPTNQYGRFVSTFDYAGDDRQVVWHPFTQSWEDRPDGLEGVFARPDQIYKSSLAQDLEGMPQPFRTNVPTGMEKGFSEYGIADQEGKHTFTRLNARGRSGVGKVEEVKVDIKEEKPPASTTSEMGSAFAKPE